MKITKYQKLRIKMFLFNLRNKDLDKQSEMLVNNFNFVGNKENARNLIKTL